MGANQSAEAQGQAQAPKEQVISATDQSTSVQVRPLLSSLSPKTNN
jgi:hypothetical protein